MSIQLGQCIPDSSVVPGVCAKCLHMLDDHRRDGTCDSCHEVTLGVLRNWAQGVGNPPDGWTAAIAQAVYELALAESTERTR